MCNSPGCGGNKRKSSSPPTNKVVNQMNDSDVVMIKYTHPNRGLHPVFGAGKKPQPYGYRKNGDEFLVKRSDQRLYPHYFQIVPDTPAPPPIAITPPPPPKLMSDTPPPPALVKMDDDTNSAIKSAVTNARFDLQLLPGVTPAIREAMSQANLSSPDSIIDGGVKALVKVKGVGQTRAKAIINYVNERYA